MIAVTTPTKMKKVALDATESAPSPNLGAAMTSAFQTDGDVITTMTVVMALTKPAARHTLVPPENSSVPPDTVSRRPSSVTVTKTASTSLTN
jgi:hypothetical protein